MALSPTNPTPNYSVSLHVLVLTSTNVGNDDIVPVIGEQFSGSKITLTQTCEEATAKINETYFDLVVLGLDPLVDEHSDVLCTLRDQRIAMPTLLMVNPEDEDRLHEIVPSMPFTWEIIPTGAINSGILSRRIRKAIETHQLNWELSHLQQAFQSSLTQYRNLFDEVPDLIFLCDRSGCLLDINATASRLFNKSKDKMVMRPVFEVLGMKRDDFEMLLQRALTKEGPIEDFEIEYHINDHEILYGLTHLIHWQSNQIGRPLQFQGVIKDITPHKRLEQQLRKSEDQYKTLYQLSRICSSSLKLEDVVSQSLEMIHRATGALGTMLMINRSYEELNLLKAINLPEDLQERFLTESPPMLGQGRIGRLAISSSMRTMEIIDQDDMHPVIIEWTNRNPDTKLMAVSIGRGNPTLPTSILLVMVDKQTAGENLSNLLDGLSRTLEMGMTNCFHYANSQEAEVRYRELWDNAPAYFISLLRGGIIFEINRTAARGMGYSNKELIGNSIRNFIVPEDMELFEAHHNRLIAYGESQDYELRMRHKDGEILTVSVRSEPLYDRDGGIVGEKSVLNDITHDKEMEERLRDYAENLEKNVMERTEELRQTMNFLNGVLEGSTEYAIVAMDEQGMFLHFNRGAQMMFGHNPADMVRQKTLGHLIDFDKTPWNSLTQLLNSVNNKEVLVVETPMQTSDGRNLIALLTMNRLKEPTHNTLTYVAIIRDISEQKELEELLKHYTDNLHHIIEQKTQELDRKHVQLVQSGKLATLGEMATGIAHELNQPLSGIRTRAQFVIKLLERGVLKPEKVDVKQREIISLIDRISRIISHMRIFARQDQQHFQPFKLNQSLEGALSLIGEQLRIHAIELVRDTTDDVPPVFGESLQIEQVLLNLLSNARDALDMRADLEADRGGESDFHKKITISIEKADNHEVLLKISDNGIGMNEETRAKIFEPFFTTKAVGRGTGLGLSISYGILTDHNGRFDVESELGRGTTFLVYLPIWRGNDEAGVVVSKQSSVTKVADEVPTQEVPTQ